MTGYLGGQFKPDQPVTLNEAVRGILALLGYTDEDFSESLSDSRMTLFYSLELDDELGRQPEEILNREDCVNLFYNLLKTEMKSGGKVYGTVLGCEANSDGESNPMALADASLSGPKVIPKGKQLVDYSGNTYKSNRTGFIRELRIESGDKVGNNTELADTKEELTGTVTLISNRDEVLDGVIILEEAEDVLIIPVDALMRGNRVYVQDSSVTESQGNVPAGFRSVEMETGLSNDSYVQIVSGLSEGNVVYLDQASKTSTDSFPMGEMPGGNGGGPGGNQGSARGFGDRR